MTRMCVVLFAVLLASVAVQGRSLRDVADSVPNRPSGTSSSVSNADTSSSNTSSGNSGNVAVRGDSNAPARDSSTSGSSTFGSNGSVSSGSVSSDPGSSAPSGSATSSVSSNAGSVVQIRINPQAMERMGSNLKSGASEMAAKAMEMGEKAGRMAVEFEKAKMGAMMAVGAAMVGEGAVMAEKGAKDAMAMAAGVSGLMSNLANEGMKLEMAKWKAMGNMAERMAEGATAMAQEGMQIAKEASAGAGNMVKDMAAGAFEVAGDMAKNGLGMAMEFEKMKLGAAVGVAKEGSKIASELAGKMTGSSQQGQDLVSKNGGPIDQSTVQKIISQSSGGSNVMSKLFEEMKKEAAKNGASFDVAAISQRLKDGGFNIDQSTVQKIISQSSGGSNDMSKVFEEMKKEAAKKGASFDVSDFIKRLKDGGFDVESFQKNIGANIGGIGSSYNAVSGLDGIKSSVGSALAGGMSAGMDMVAKIGNKMSFLTPPQVSGDLRIGNKSFSFGKKV